MKRLISLVLVAALSFFSFMVYGEDPGNDNTGYLPSVLLGNLNLTAGQGLAPYFGPTGRTDYKGSVYLNGSYLSSFHHLASTNKNSYISAPAGWDIGSVTFYFGEQGGKSSLTAGRVMAAPDGVYAVTFLSSAGYAECRKAPAHFEFLGWSGNTVYLRCLEPYPLSATFNFTSLVHVGSSGEIPVSALSVQYLNQYSGSASDFQEWLDNNYQGAVNPGQSGANQEIQDNVGQLENFDNQIFTDVSHYTSQLDFGLGDWSEAAAGISYIGSIFMLIWDNSPTQVIVLSLMVGLCLLILGRGPRVAGEVRRHEERASRRKKGG